MSTIYAIVNSEGNVINGNINATKKKDGYYEVDFLTRFSSVPCVLVTADTDGQENEQYTVAISVKNVSVSGFNVSLQNLSLAPFNGGFNILASDDFGS